MMSSCGSRGGGMPPLSLLKLVIKKIYIFHVSCPLPSDHPGSDADESSSNVNLEYADYTYFLKSA